MLVVVLIVLQGQYHLLMELYVHRVQLIHTVFLTLLLVSIVQRAVLLYLVLQSALEVTVLRGTSVF